MPLGLVRGAAGAGWSAGVSGAGGVAGGGGGASFSLDAGGFAGGGGGAALAGVAGAPAAQGATAPAAQGATAPAAQGAEPAAQGAEPDAWAPLAAGRGGTGWVTWSKTTAAVLTARAAPKRNVLREVICGQIHRGQTSDARRCRRSTRQRRRRTRASHGGSPWQYPRTARRYCSRRKAARHSP